MLSERFRPVRLSALIGNEQARLDMVKWLKKWKPGDKPLLLTGPPGIGKSTSIYALAREFGYSVIELNASDVRTRDNLREVLGPAIENKSLFGDEKLLVFLDEIDGLAGRADYAGMDYVIEFIENASIPVAMAANQEETQKLRKIEQKSFVLRFRPITEDLVFAYLESICERAEISAEDEILWKIAKSCRGDVRQAINSLQTLQGRKISGSATDQEFVSDSAALEAIFQAKSLAEAQQRLRQFDAPPFEKIRAIFDSVVSAKNLSIESRSESLDLISRADIIMGEISRQQSWRLLRYLDRFLAAATISKKLQRTDSSIPWNVRLAIWNDGRVLKSIENDLAPKFHVGKGDFATFYLPYLATFLRDKPNELDSFLSENEFGDSEKRVLLKVATKR